MVLFAGKVRDAFIGGEISSTMSPRGLLSMAAKYEQLLPISPNSKAAMDKAVHTHMLNRVTDDSYQRVVEIYNPCFKH